MAECFLAEAAARLGPLPWLPDAVRDSRWYPRLDHLRLRATWGAWCALRGHRAYADLPFDWVIQGEPVTIGFVVRCRCDARRWCEPTGGL